MQTSRPPIVTIMGHVDHGKTSLLDFIRKTHVTAREAGGITQHIGAYQIEFQKKKITFIDTPGHAAFNKMRARGAKVTDLVILVVAANDGVKPQTIESIRHIQEAGVPLVVAINKIDLPNVYPDMAKAQLAEHGILVQGYGGDVDVVELSAKTGKGVDQLLSLIVTMAELNNYQADPEADLSAIVVESTRDQKRGSVATVIVQQGTLSIRQDITVDGVVSRVRQLLDENRKPLTTVLPGCPAEIVGFSSVPAVGAHVYEAGKEVAVEAAPEVAAENVPTDYTALFNEHPKLKLMIKADVQGTLEAIMQNIDDESTVVLRSGVGELTEDDVDFAETTKSLVLVFHTKISRQVEEKAKNAKVKIKQYDVIYKLLEDLQKQMLKLLEPTIDEVVTGEIEILQIFEMKGEKIAGARVITGELKKLDRVHLKRGEEILFDPEIKSMMHGKDQIDIARTKSEFGLTFKKRADFQVGDHLVAYTVIED